MLMPSLWRESLGRVPIEAMANGIPVLASDRGALPETLGDAGFVFTIPDRCTPASGMVPTAQEVAPWMAVIERLWDDREFEAEHRRRSLAEARRWDGDKLAEQYESFFRSSCREGRRTSVRISSNSTGIASAAFYSQGGARSNWPRHSRCRGFRRGAAGHFSARRR